MNLRCCPLAQRLAPALRRDGLAWILPAGRRGGVADQCRALSAFEPQGRLFGRIPTATYIFHAIPEIGQPPAGHCNARCFVLAAPLWAKISRPKVTIRPGWASDSRAGHDDGGRCSGRNIGTMISTGSWIGRNITIAQTRKGRVCAQGWVWDFDRCSAEICQIGWHGPN